MSFDNPRSSYKTLIRFSILLLLLLVTLIYSKHNLHVSIFKKNSNTLKPNGPTIARVLYLFLCENQAEMNGYSKVLPSTTADVMFFCWKENCNDTNFSRRRTFNVTQWSGSIPKHQSLMRSDPKTNYTEIQPHVFILNEQELNLTHKTTWAIARNLLLERAVIEERRQGWRWAYFIFGDGDVQLACPVAEKLLKTNKTDGNEVLFVEYFRSVVNDTINNSLCFLLFDAFLLSVSPAIGVIGGMLIPNIYDGLLTQVVYHVDAMFNAFHRDAIPFILPYCPRYDKRSWHTSQAILIYRSLCLYGHVIQLNSIWVSQQKHRDYPRNGNSWSFDQDMNLVPLSLVPLQNYMQTSRTVSPLVLRHYNGWSLELASDECRQGHTYVDPSTCKVSGQQNKTNS